MDELIYVLWILTLSIAYIGTLITNSKYKKLISNQSKTMAKKALVTDALSDIIKKLEAKQ